MKPKYVHEVPLYRATFIRRTQEIEVFEFVNENYAWDTFRMYCEKDSMKVYESVTLEEISVDRHHVRKIASMHFEGVNE